MRHWERAPVNTICGFCADWIKKADPIEIITLPNMDTEKIRCERCAETSKPFLPLFEEGMKEL